METWSTRCYHTRKLIFKQSSNLGPVSFILYFFVSGQVRFRLTAIVSDTVRSLIRNNFSYGLASLMDRVDLTVMFQIWKTVWLIIFFWDIQLWFYFRAGTWSSRCYNIRKLIFTQSSGLGTVSFTLFFSLVRSGSDWLELFPTRFYFELGFESGGPGSGWHTFFQKKKINKK